MNCKSNQNNNNQNFSKATMHRNNAGQGVGHAAGHAESYIDSEKTLKLALRDSAETLRMLQKSEVLAKLMGGIAHDLNNLQHGIVASLELVRRLIAAGRAAETERFVASAIASAQRTSELNERLLRFSRAQPVEARPLSINDAIAEAIELLRHAFPKSVTIDWKPEPDPWLVFCDGSQIEIAAINLALNAREAMPEGGAMQIKTANVDVSDAAPARALGIPAGEYACLCVTDSGQGMNEDIRSRAFEPFFTTKARGFGSGLGLSAVREMALHYGGTAAIDGTPGRGAKVILYLPRYRAAG